MFKFSMGYLPVLAAGLLAVTATASATAGILDRGDQPPSVTVRYDDLNLSTRDGRTVLYRRLQRAAGQVCPSVDSADLGQIARAQHCQVAAVQRAVRQIGGPMVAQLQAEHGLAQERSVSQN
ncbi:MAG TPA: UrcA family protein [Steroidobacteraceae bacterium]|nr:UrcA family protein [Steroidobacteraceae bacterium]